jgi:hypothetical protein
MKILHSGDKLTSIWYSTTTDTGLTMNFHSLSPIKYKCSVVAGMVYRIHHACSTWENFHSSLERAKSILKRNQYPPSFFEPIIERTLNKISQPERTEEDKEEEQEEKLITIPWKSYGQFCTIIKTHKWTV